MKAIKNILMLAMFSGIANMVNAQSNESSVGAFMRSNERSYVVIAVMVTILTGLILYIVRVDRKISRLEKEK